MSRQCALLNIPRSSYYYQPATVDQLTFTLLNLIDEEYTRHPFLGVRKMTAYVNQVGYVVNVKRVRRLYKTLGIEAIEISSNFVYDF